MLKNPRHERFCQEYLIDLNATAAYKRAGFKARGHSAETGAYATLRIPQVAERIQELMRERQERTQLTADRVLKEYAAIAFSKVTDYAIDDQGVRVKDGVAPEAIRAVASFKHHADGAVEVKLWPKNDALYRLGQHLNLFDKITPMNPDGTPYDGGRLESLRAVAHQLRGLLVDIERRRRQNLADPSDN